jgi:RNA polymerase sigma-70 factor (ECF subfamily)
MEVMMLFNNKKKKFETESLKYMDNLYYLAIRFTGNEASASDLVQETYLKAFSNYKKFQEDTNLKAWLFRILTNTFINDYRKRRRENLIMDFTENESVYYNWLDDSVKKENKSPENKYFFKNLGEEIYKELDSLPDNFKMMILYADVYEFSYKEISEIIDAPIGTVMSKLFRARKLLQTKLYHRAEEMGLLKENKKNNNIIKLVG